MDIEEKFEAYFNEEFELAEKSAFEDQLSTDSNMRAAYEAYSKERVLIESHFLKEDLKNRDLVKPKRTVKFKWAIVLAALIISIAAAFYYLDRVESPTESPDLYVYSEYTPHPGTPISMSVNETSEFEDGMIDYKEGKSKTAIKKWMTLYAIEPNNHDLNFFLANAHIMQNEIEQSVSYLNKTIETSGNYKDRADWILSLIELDRQKPDALNKIANTPEHSYVVEAKALLNSLEN